MKVKVKVKVVEPDAPYKGLPLLIPSVLQYTHRQYTNGGFAPFILNLTFKLRPL